MKALPYVRHPELAAHISAHLPQRHYVLSVMDNAIEDMRADGCTGMVEHMIAARAQMAEIISDRNRLRDGLYRLLPLVGPGAQR